MTAICPAGPPKVCSETANQVRTRVGEWHDVSWATLPLLGRGALPGPGLFGWDAVLPGHAGSFPSSNCRRKNSYAPSNSGLVSSRTRSSVATMDSPRRARSKAERFRGVVAAIVDVGLVHGRGE